MEKPLAIVTADARPPEGYEPFGRTHIGYVNLIGPLFIKRDENGVAIGWRVQPLHCNAYAMAHGGMTTGFADIVTSFVVFESRMPRAEVLTISLTTDFLSIAPLGSWVEGRGKVVQMGSSIAFSTCEIFADGKLIGHASGKFKVRAKH